MTLTEDNILYCILVSHKETSLMLKNKANSLGLPKSNKELKEFLNRKEVVKN